MRWAFDLPGMGTASSAAAGSITMAHAMRTEVRSATTARRDPCEASHRMQEESQDARGSHGLSVSA
jgi:Na+/H+-translocating membrane pyrophosphatase